MMTKSSSRAFLSWLLFGWFAAFSATVAVAAGDPPGVESYVEYGPGTVQSMQGDAPFLGSYVLSVTSPSATPVGNYVVTLNSTVVSAPLGADPVTAASFLTFSIPSLVFTGPGQTRSVTVSVRVPIGSATGAFSYSITTAGWPTGFSIRDLGTTVNMTVLSSGIFPPPTVTIISPEDNTVYTRPIGGAPVLVPINITATAAESATLLTLTATISGVATDGSVIAPAPLQLVTTGLGSAYATSVVPYLAVKSGIYTVTTIATNSQGQGTDATTFEVREGRPPKVTISEPPDASYDYYLGSTPLTIPFTFVGESLDDAITALTATIDGIPVQVTSGDLGARIATGISSLGNVTTAGVHQVVVTAEDVFGTATASTSFTVNVIRPTPTIVINEPSNGAIFTLGAGATTMDVPFSFTTSTSPGFTVSSISATLSGSPIAVPTQTGIGTQTAIGSGTMTSLAAGTYTLTAYGVSAGIQVQTSVTFTINKPVVVNTPPTVVIVTPPAGSTYVLASDGCGGTSSLRIPLTFTGTSTTTGAVITKLTASVDGIALAVSSGNLNQKIANGSATMTITTTGTHTIKVTATDAYGTATASRTFTVTVSAVKQQVTGAVFFDVDLNGVRSTDEYGLSDVSVKLVNTSGQTVATATTGSDGSYSFSVLPGSYIVSVGAVNGMSLTTLNDNAITVVAAAVKAPDTGYGLYFAAIRNMCANGFTIGYWKNNVDKALACKSSGTQVSASTIKSYTCVIGSLALEPFTGLTMSKATAIMGSTSSAPADLLAKQLVASEYNYCNGAFMNGDRRLTYAFIYYSEYVFKNATRYGGTYVLWVKDWCDAYNNSHGGKVLGPSS